MKVAIYSPYLDTFGGGERYMMTIAEILSHKANVDVLLDRHLAALGKDYLKKNLEQRFGIDLSSVEFTEAPVGEGSNFAQRLLLTRSYDLLIYLTDGSIFIPFARKNILHIQTPLMGQPTASFWGKVKLSSWNLIIYNSNFTRQAAQKYWPAKSEVVYPPVDVKKIKPLKKEKLILSVGRFFGFLKNKKHELLIKTFKEIYKNKNLKGWSLNLVGAASNGDKKYIDDLKSKAQGLPVNFSPNLSYDELIKMYGRSSLYWHAAGFGENDPAKMEHFGISTVEAMAGGCVPVVIEKGGQIEIIEQGKSGFLWDNLSQLKEVTLRIITDADLFQRVSGNAVKRSNYFSKENFAERIMKLVGL